MADRQNHGGGRRRPRARVLIALAAGAALAALSGAAVAQRGGDDRGGNEPSERERQGLADLASEIDGAIVYGRRGRILKVVLGEWKTTDLGEGEYARWSRDGKQIAVWHDDTVSVMNADGTGRRELVRRAAKEEDGCPIEFHPSGREIVYGKRGDGLWSVNVGSGATRKLGLPDDYTGEPCFSADGKRLAARVDNDLYAVDLTAGTHRKFARGCSPNVSPDGARLLNNTGGHRELVIRNWDGSDQKRINTRTMRPDREWDDHHWSNHADYLTTNGEGSREEAYVVTIPANRVTRVSWGGRSQFPDLFVARAKKAAAASESAPTESSR
uniref:TolB protein, periplasmic protein involved in the tonb-independent uptake of group A colicins n=1 Tax=uncultured Armatimonadetes bacterium TaxID=157466 RepID=A0A6J4IWU4_9BACT|nr:hypothetical protein AVDCRST_MAG63-2575 [uncultured Armatimonadetes bacterium]